MASNSNSVTSANNSGDVEVVYVGGMKYEVPKALAEVLKSSKLSSTPPTQITVYNPRSARFLEWVAGVGGIYEKERVDLSNLPAVESDYPDRVFDRMVNPGGVIGSVSSTVVVAGSDSDAEVVFEEEKPVEVSTVEEEFDPLNFEIVRGGLENPGGVNLLNTDVEELTGGVRVKKMGKLYKHVSAQGVKDFVGLISSGSERRKAESMRKSNVVLKEITEEAAHSGDTDYWFACSEKQESPKVSESVANDLDVQVLEESSSAPPKKGELTSARRKSSRVNIKRKMEMKVENTPMSTARKSKKPRVGSVPQKEILMELECSKKFLCDEGFSEVYDLLKAQGWEKLCEKQEYVCPEAVQDFYRGLILHDGAIPSLEVHFRENQFSVSSLELALIMEMDHEGYDVFLKSNVWPVEADEKSELVRRICNLDRVPKGCNISTQFMEPRVKMAHKLLVSNFLQRGVKPSYVQQEDLLLLDKLLRKERINLPKLIIYQMDRLKDLTQIGFSRVIKKILQMHQLYEISAEGELPVVKEFDAGVFRKMHLIKIPDQGWVRSSGQSSEVRLIDDGTGGRTAEADEADKWLVVEEIRKDLKQLKVEFTEFKNEIKDQMKEVQDALMMIAGKL